MKGVGVLRSECRDNTTTTDCILLPCLQDLLPVTLLATGRCKQVLSELHQSKVDYPLYFDIVVMDLQRTIGALIGILSLLTPARHSATEAENITTCKLEKSGLMIPS